MGSVRYPGPRPATCMNCGKTVRPDRERYCNHCGEDFWDTTTPLGGSAQARDAHRDSGGETRLAPSYRSSGTRSKWALVLVGIATADITFYAFMVFGGLGYFPTGGTSALPGFEIWAISLEGAQTQYVLLVLAGAVGVIAWLARVVDNMPALGRGKPVSSPAGAILWWFVPIANLFQPYRIVADAWRRLARSPAEAETRLVLAWWLSWIGGLVVGRVANGLPVNTIEDVRTAIILSGSSLLASAVGGVLLMRIIWLAEQRSAA